MTVHRGLKVVVAVLILVAPLLVAAQSSSPLIYTVSLAHPGNHLVHIIMQLGPGTSERELQLPVWTSLIRCEIFRRI